MLTEKQQKAIELFKLGKSFCLTGQAGTGKSHIIKEISSICKEKDFIFAITALTGCAANLIKGQTVHRFFGVGTAESDTETLITKIRMKNPTARKRIQNTKILVIDEISMMSGNLFDKLETISRKIRKNDEFFGGIQIILSGDFCQLQPIGDDTFCFESKVWKKNIKDIIYLEEIIRQSDPIFQKLLTEIRLGILTEETKNILSSRKIKNIKEAYISINNANGTNDGISIIPTILYPHKINVENINNNELVKLKKTGNDCKTYIAVDNSISLGKTKRATKEEVEMLDKYCNTPTIIELTIKSQVMLTVNLDVESGLVNGARGVITSFKEENPVIMFDNGLECDIEKFKFEVDMSSKILTRNQIPLILAWAITIHKSQGATLTHVITDLNNVFCDGQSYVTLSRVKSLDGLFITNIDFRK